MTGKEILKITAGKMVIIGRLALIDDPNGDSYCGEVVEHHGDTIVLTSYSVWYEGETDPVDGPEGDEVRIAITDETIVSFP